VMTAMKQCAVVAGTAVVVAVMMMHDSDDAIADDDGDSTNFLDCTPHHPRCSWHSQDVTDGKNMPQFCAAMWALARACYKVTRTRKLLAGVLCCAVAR